MVSNDAYAIAKDLPKTGEKFAVYSPIKYEGINEKNADTSTT